MKMSLLIVLTAGIIFTSLLQKNEKAVMEENPFFKKYSTPFETPPFEKIKEEHFLPALKAGIEEQKKEIQAIVDNKAKATFENTIMALDLSGSLLNKVYAVFSHLSEANTTEGLQKINEIGRAHV